MVRGGGCGRAEPGASCSTWLWCRLVRGEGGGGRTPGGGYSLHVGARRGWELQMVEVGGGAGGSIACHIMLNVAVAQVSGGGGGG